MTPDETPARTIELQGHRGALAHWPGNSVTSLAHTLGVGVHSIEIDVWVTADDELVVVHDNKVERSDGTVVHPHHLPLQEIPVLRTHQPELAEHRSPTLAEVLALFRFAGARDVILDVEVKGDATLPPAYADITGRATARALARHLGEQALRVRSFDRRVLAAVAAEVPEIERLGLVGTGGDDLAAQENGGAIAATVEQAIAMTEDLGLAGLAPQAPLVDAHYCETAHAAGLRVISWGGSGSHEEIAGLLEAGVDGLCVDDPGAVRRQLADAGIPVPDPHPIDLPALRLPA